MSNIGERIKRYEAVSAFSLLPRSPLFIRVDGKAFHTYTRGCEKPFDQHLIDSMTIAAQKTAREMSGFVAAYLQSDECTFMLSDYENFNSQGWFNYELNKVVSISSSAFTAYFNEAYKGSSPAMFDSRAFTIPIEEAPNVFIWRQRDWERNSIQMLARAHFSHSECDGKKVPDLHEMLHGKGVNWAALSEQLKNGTYLFKDLKPQSFKADYEDLQKLLISNNP
jgi:tRNA(His) guanylyltransferase